MHNARGRRRAQNVVTPSGAAARPPIGCLSSTLPSGPMRSGILKGVSALRKTARRVFGYLWYLAMERTSIHVSCCEAGCRCSTSNTRGIKPGGLQSGGVHYGGNVDAERCRRMQCRLGCGFSIGKEAWDVR